MKIKTIVLLFFVNFIFTNYSAFAQIYDFSEKLVPVDLLESYDHFSHFDAVSIDGDYAVVGAHNYDGDAISDGLVFLYNWNDTLCHWQLIDTISSKSAISVSGKTPNSGFGTSVCIKDNIIVIGAPTYNFLTDFGGRVFVYKIIDNQAIFVQTLKAIRNDLSDDSELGSSFGIDLDWDGQQLIVAAPFETEDDALTVVNQAGAAYIYSFSSGSFNFLNKVYAPNRFPLDHFGISVAIHGSYAIVGARFEDEDELETNTMVNSGSAYIYEFDELLYEWNFLQKIVAPDRANDDNFGYGVDIYQQHIVVGAYSEDEDEAGGSSLSSAGSAYVYEFNSLTNIYEFNQKLVPSDREIGANFGFEVKIYDQTILISAPLKDFGALINTGQAYTFKKSITWVEDQIITASLPQSDDYFGESIEMDYRNLIIGAYLNDSDEDDLPTIKSQIGAAYIYSISKHPVFGIILTDQVGYCAGKPIKFEVLGTLNDAYGWEWFENTCDGPYLGEGDSIILEITETTIICARPVGCFDFSVAEDCHCIEINVNTDYWHQTTTNGLVETPSDVITDAEGNVYVTGIYKGFSDFDGGDNVDVTVDDGIPGFTNYDKSFVAKYDNCGNLLWVSFAYGNEQSDYSNAITLKESDEVLYIVGEFRNSITMHNGIGAEGIGVGSFTATTSGQKGYVAQINRADGKVHFIQPVSSTLPHNRLTEITINELNGDIYVGGQTYSSPGLEKIFLQKYTPNYLGLGGVRWETKSLFETGAIINGMDFDESSPASMGEGALWVTGTYRDNLQMPGTSALYSGAATTDAFVLKYFHFDGGIMSDYATTEFLKRGFIASSPGNFMEGNDIAVDPATGNAYITGTKIGLVNSAFGMLGEDLPLVSSNQVGYFVGMKYDGGIPVGALSEITYPDVTTFATGEGVSIKNENVYFTGERRGAVKFKLAAPYLSYTGLMEQHLYIVSYNLSDGSFDWANGTLNPDPVGQSPHLPVAISTDNQGHAFIVGNFRNKMGYILGAPSSGDLTYSSNGGTLFTMRVDIEGTDEIALQSPVQDDFEHSIAQVNNQKDLFLNHNLDLDLSPNIRLFPNPTSDKTMLIIDNYSDQQEHQVKLYSLDGKLLFFEPLNNNRLELNLTNYESGLYIIEVQGTNFTQRLTLVKTP